MNRNDYSVGNLIHDGELYDYYLNDFTDDLEFYKKWCLKADGPVLELCAGTGRLTIPLKENGINITGLDISDSMLKKAEEKNSKKEIEIDFIKGDIR